MSDHRVLPALKPLVEAGTELDLSGFRPSAAQSKAKARLQAALAQRQGLVSVEALSQAELATMAGDRRVGRWLTDPAFAAWLTDRDTFVHHAVALRESAVQVLEDILLGDYDPKCLTAKDKLKAIDLLFQLTGAYPKSTQVKFLDRDLDSMDEAEVDRQLLAKGTNPAKLR